MNSCRRSFFLSIMCFFLGGGIASVQAQNFDYESRPVINFNLQKAVIRLTVDPANEQFSGSVDYTMQANINGADSVRLHAVNMNIDSVLVQGKPVDFSYAHDQLAVPVADSSQIGQAYQLKIVYRTAAGFGFLKDSDNSMWTSTLPRSTRHWLPVIDNPRVQLTATLSLRVLADVTAFASGVKTDERTVGDGIREVTFRTGRPVPVTSLSFGMGHFYEQGVSMGIKRINSYSETGSINRKAQTHLLNDAKNIMKTIAQATGLKYPYQRIHLVILNDDFWEQKPYAASTIFLYKNRGDFRAQLQRGLYGQWLGVYEHEATWGNSWPVSMLQAALHNAVQDSLAPVKINSEAPTPDSSTVYYQFSPEVWNKWQQYVASLSTREQMENQLIPAVLKSGSGIITPQSLENMWYRQSGQPTIHVPDFKQRSTGAAAKADSILYRVNYDLDKASNSLKLSFYAKKGRLSQTLTVPVLITSNGKLNRKQVTISGGADSMTVAIPAGTQNVQLRVPSNMPHVFFEQHKPIPYVLYQLRNAKTMRARTAAATQIGYHTNEPDLQLALNDVMKQEMPPQVEAALLRSYGKITNGATGTEQRFLTALENDSPAIRAAALQVLANYDADDVTDKLQSFINTEPDDSLSGRALTLYFQRVDSSDALDYTNNLIQQDTSGVRAIEAIAALAAKGNEDQAVKRATYYVEPVFSYPVRKKALQILLNYDASASAWKKRTPDLINDVDPRIRYFVADHLPTIPGIDADAMIKSRLSKEYDARVYQVLRRQEGS